MEIQIRPLSIYTQIFKVIALNTKAKICCSLAIGSKIDDFESLD